MEIKLTDKQERFCVEYMKDLNATQAAIRAGYSEKTANVISAQNLSKISIQTRIAELQKEVADRNNVQIDDVVRSDARVLTVEWTDLHHFDGFVYFCKPLDELTEAQRSAVACVRTENGRVQYVLKDQDKAKERLMKHLGGFERDNKKSIEYIVPPPTPKTNPLADITATTDE